MRKHRYIYWTLLSIISILSVTSLYYGYETKSLKNKVENNYNRAFHELVSYVDDVDTLLQKCMLTSGAEQMSTISSDIFRQSAAAKACLGQLPISEVNLENTEKFLSQVGDYTYLLSQSVIGNNDLTEDEYKTLQDLSKYATMLNNKLLEMQEDIYDGDISFGTINDKAKTYFNNPAYADDGDILSGFDGVEKEFQEYPSLIYDGPFSEHINRLKPALLEGENEISKDEAYNIAKEFLPTNSDNLSFNSESKNTAIETYSFSSYNDDVESYISISKKGGIPLYFINSRGVSEENLNFNDAIAIASEFLRNKGFISMKESYYEKDNNVATINFAYVQGDVICYSDLIKVKVALDNGEILGYEAHGYIMNHSHRTVNSPKLSQDEAKEFTNKHLKISATTIALIPKDSKREVLCYEFKGNHNGKNFLIYINADTGVEEQILMLIESKDGILTI